MGSPAASIFAAGPGRDRRIALTFDDGPAASTEAVLDVLSAEAAPATFFIVGGFVAGRESTLQRAKAAGHVLGVHGWNHFNALHMREPETLVHELSACADELEQALGERPQLVRPPYGGDAGRTARAAAKLGLGPVVLWTVLCFDWEDDAQADAIAERAVAEAHPGAIICLHDGDRKDPAVTRDATVAALPAIVQGLRRDGYELATVSDLLRMIELFPTGSRIESGVLQLDGLAATELAERFGTPLVVYSERALRERAQMFRRAVPDALVVYGTKAFPNVAVMRLLAEEGLGADVASLGELAFARRAGIEGSRLIVHGNNKSDEELRAAAEAGALVAIDALDEPARAAEAGVRRVLVRVTPGVETETHEAIRTGHRGSKFGLDADEALIAIAAARAAGLEVEGLHVHVGSQLADGRAHLEAVSQLGEFATRCRDELDWTPALVDVGGGFGVRHVEEESEPPVEELVRSIADAVASEWATRGLPAPRLVFEPGRSLVGPAAFTLYRVGAVKHAGDTRYVAIDGGMSDNPRPQLYDARYSALLANRAAEEPAEGHFTIAGKHCESGDELIERAVLPEPRRGDLIAVPATGGYTLSMSSNYNGVPRPAAVLVSGADARLILRRETVDDLLAREP